YKTVRYSGKEMDVSGLYYYGLRYYAPWLQRWVSADPAGDVDGLNLYAMVSNSPISFVDRLGLAGDPVQEIRNTSNSMISSNALHAFEAPRNVPKKQTTALEAQHKAQHPYYNYTKSKKAKLIVNAGGSLSDADPEQTFFMNAHHNIPHPSGISSTPGLTLVDSKSNAEFRTYKVSDIGKFKTHLEAKYESYYNSDESTVLTYKGSSQTPIDFQTVRREKNAVLLSDDVWEATLDHLNKNNFLLPEPDGIPGAHGEVLVKNTASLLKTSEQKEIVKIWTFKITTPATEAFAACTNCTGILRSAQGNISAEVQTGYNDEKLSTWRGTHTF
ncbi:RHS repeat-associated core domain-containing protein, partial [Pseudomonas sp. ANT_H12B]|uniref:RHS repeat-associated core domain-containing protein n=1 Tax=Pseudomonas sp. ANT_H12B TaxID=2597348 RepID=UPI00273F5C1E